MIVALASNCFHYWRSILIILVFGGGKKVSKDPFETLKLRVSNCGNARNNKLRERNGFERRGKIPILQLFLYFYLELNKIFSPINRSQQTRHFNSIVFSNIIAQFTATFKQNLFFFPSACKKKWKRIDYKLKSRKLLSVLKSECNQWSDIWCQHSKKIFSPILYTIIWATVCLNIDFIIWKIDNNGVLSKCAFGVKSLRWISKIHVISARKTVPNLAEPTSTHMFAAIWAILVHHLFPPQNN